MRMFPWKRSIIRAVWRFDDTGATAIEYALIASLIAISIVAGALLLGNSLDTLYLSFGNLFT